MSISCQHDDCISKGEKFISISIVFFVSLKVSDCEFPNDPLNLLCLSRESELGQQLSNGFVILDFFEFEKFAVGMKNF